MNREQALTRMAELMKPLTQQIMMCDDHNDMLMLASCFLVVTKDILDKHIGNDGRKLMFKEFT